MNDISYNKETINHINKLNCKKSRHYYNTSRLLNRFGAIDVKL